MTAHDWFKEIHKDNLNQDLFKQIGNILDIDKSQDSCWKLPVKKVESTRWKVYTAFFGNVGVYIALILLVIPHTNFVNFWIITSLFVLTKSLFGYLVFSDPGYVKKSEHISFLKLN